MAKNKLIESAIKDNLKIECSEYGDAQDNQFFLTLRGYTQNFASFTGYSEQEVLIMLGMYILQQAGVNITGLQIQANYTLKE